MKQLIKLKPIVLFCIVLFFGSLNFSICFGQIRIHVAPQGNDHWNGTAEKPFFTLGKAQAAVRNELKKKPGCDIEVVLHKGDYYLQEPLSFTSEDSPEGNYKVTWKSDYNQRARIVGAVKLSGWEKNGDVIPEIPEILRDRIYSVKLPVVQGKTILPKILFADLMKLKRTRGKGFEPTDALDRAAGEEGGFSDSINNNINFPRGAMRNWSNLPDVELIIRPSFGWVMNILGVAKVDEVKRNAQTTIPATYPMKPLNFQQFQPFYQQYFPNGKESVWVENIFDAMKETGNWVIDSRRGKIFLVTDGNPPVGAVYAPVLKELVSLTGNSLNGKIVKNITFRDIDFSFTDRDTWTKEEIGRAHV